MSQIETQDIDNNEDWKLAEIKYKFLKMEYNTEQESFWAGDFGDHYIERNKGKK